MCAPRSSHILDGQLCSGLGRASMFVVEVGWGRGGGRGVVDGRGRGGSWMAACCCCCCWQVTEERLCEHGEIMLSPLLPSLPQLRGGFGLVWINLPDSGLYLETVLCVCDSVPSIVSLSLNWLNHRHQRTDGTSSYWTSDSLCFYRSLSKPLDFRSSTAVSPDVATSAPPPCGSNLALTWGRLRVESGVRCSEWVSHVGHVMSGWSWWPNSCRLIVGRKLKQSGPHSTGAHARSVITDMDYRPALRPQWGCERACAGEADWGEGGGALMRGGTVP